MRTVPSVTVASLASNAGYESASSRIAMSSMYVAQGVHVEVRCHLVPAHRNILPLDSGVFGLDQVFQADPLVARDAQRFKDLISLSREENGT